MKYLMFTINPLKQKVRFSILLLTILLSSSSIFSQSTCPTIEDFTLSFNPICFMSVVQGTATGLTAMDMQTNGEQDFGIELVYFDTTPTDPYVGGTSLGMVGFADLENGNTEAVFINFINSSNIPFAGTYEVYTILTPTPSDPACRPSAFDILEVEGLPVLVLELPAELQSFCDSDEPIDISNAGTPPGGFYFGPGVNDNNDGVSFTYDPSQADVPMSTITYQVTDDSQCSFSTSISIDVEILEGPVIDFELNVSPQCSDDAPITDLGNASPTGGVYSGPGVTDDGNGMTFTFDPAAANIGDNEITYTATGDNGCSSTAIQIITVGPIDLTFSAPDDGCLDEFSVTRSLDSLETITFAGTLEDTDPTYQRMSNDSNCSQLGDGNFLVHFDTFTFGVDEDIEGVISSVSFPGTHFFALFEGSFDPDNGCATFIKADQAGFFDDGIAQIDHLFLADTTYVLVISQQAVSSPLGDYEAQVSFVNNDITGTFSGPGVTDAGNNSFYDFDPEVAGPGTHTITYDYVDQNGCTNSVTEQVEVFDLPSVSFELTDSLFCKDALIINNLGGGLPAGGVYSGSAVTDDGNGLTFSLDADNLINDLQSTSNDEAFRSSANAPLISPVNYTVTDANGCSNSATDFLIFNELPNVSIANTNTEVCLNEGVVSDLTGGMPSGGIYSGLGVTDDGNGLTYSFDPTLGSIGDNDLTYTFTDENGCSNTATDNITIIEADTTGLEFLVPTDACINDTVQIVGSLDGLVLPVGSTLLAFQGINQLFGQGDITLQFDAGLDLIDTLTFPNTIGIVDLMVNPATQELFVAGFTNSSGSKILGKFDFSSGEITEIVPIPGEVTIGAFDNSNNLYADIFNSIFTINLMDGDTTFFANMTSTNVIDITFNPDDNSIYTLGDSSPQPILERIDLATNAQSVVPLQNSPVTEFNSFVYIGDGTFLAQGNDLNYYIINLAGEITEVENNDNDVEFSTLEILQAPVCTYSGPGVTDNGDGTYDFDPAAAGVGVHTITCDFTSGACSSSLTEEVEVFDLLAVTLDLMPDPICGADGILTNLGGGSPTGGVYSGAGVTDDGNGMTFTVDVSISLSPEITYTIVDENSCSSFAVDTLTIIGSSLDLLPLGICLDDAVGMFTLGGGMPLGGVYSGVGITDDGNGETFTLDTTGVVPGSSIIVTYTTDQDGCITSTSAPIAVDDCSADIADPCACLDNATVFDIDAGTGGDDGQFSEIVSVTGAGGSALPTGQTWTVTAATGAFDAFDVPAVGTQSAGVPVATDGSVTLVFNAGAYEVPFVHVDDLGYTMTIEGPFAVGDPANVSLDVANKCAYPNPIFNPTIPSIVFEGSSTIFLEVTDSNGDSGSFDITIDGIANSIIDPTVLSVGPHVVVGTFEQFGSGGISPDGGTTAAQPGCTQAITQVFEIVECMLEVDCSNITDQTFACFSEVPEPDTTLINVDMSCGDVTINTIDDFPVTGDCPNISFVRFYTITDEVGNTETCTQTFTIMDTIAPVIACPADLTVECDGNTEPESLDPENVTASNTTSVNIPDDNPAGIDIGLTVSGIPAGAIITDIEVTTAITHSFIGDLIMQLTSPTGESIVLVDRPGRPPNATGGLGDGSDADMAGPITWNDAATAIAENLGNQVGLIEFVCIDDGICDYQPENSFMSLISALMANGSDPNGQWTINISDNFIIDTGSFDSWDINISYVLPGTGTAVATDNCTAADDVVIAFTDIILPDGALGTCSQNFTISRTWTATDACDNTSTCVQTINVVDSTLPVIATAPGSLDQVVNITTQDACPDGALGFTCFFQSSLITPVSVDVQLDGTFLGNFAGPDPADVSDNCELTNITCSLETPVVDGCQLVRVINWFGVDDCGNQSLPFAQTITINELAAPDFTCPENVTIQCNSDTSPANTGMATATDNCSAPDEIVIAFTDESTQGTEGCSQFEFTITRTWTATDACGNTSTCVQTIDIIDNSPPLISCPSSRTIQCDEDTSPTNTGIATAIDNCSASDDLTFQFTDLSTQGTEGCSQFDYTITRRWVVTDNCGNANNSSTVCVQIIDVVDTTPPVITCPADVTLECDAADISLLNTGFASATDNCTIEDLVIVTSEDESTQGTSGCDQHMFTITRTFTATDECGNTSTCEQMINVRDTTPPVITCPADVTLECDAADISLLNTGFASAEDNCSGDDRIIVNFEDESTQGTTGCDQHMFTITRTFTATDGCGNTSTCEQTINVVDTTAPVAPAAPADEMVQCAADASAPADLTAVDNCDENITVSPTVEITPGACVNEFVEVRTWTFVDACGNESSISQTITVSDTIVPVVLCQDITIELDAMGLASITAIDVDGGSTDNCTTSENLTFAVSQEDFTCDNIGANTITLTVTDECGNESECTATVTVEENIAPAAICQDITAFLDENGMVSITAEDIDGGSTDACGILSLSIDIENFTCDNIDDNLVTLTVEDVNGNIDSCTATVTVLDTIPPMLSCRDIDIFLDADGQASVTGEQLAGMITVSSTGGNNAGNTMGNPGQTFYTVNITEAITLDIDWLYNTSDGDGPIFDPFGYHLNGDFVLLSDTLGDLSQSGSFSITLSPGDIFGPQVNTVDNGFGAATGSFMGLPIVGDFSEANWSLTNINADGTASFSNSIDNCGSTTFVVDMMDFTCDDVGDNTVTVTATDVNGNVAICESIVSVFDTIAPVAVCQNITVELDDMGQGSIVAADVDGGSTDNCDFVLSVSQEDFTCADIGDNTVTLTVTDESGNVSLCEATVTVLDTLVPEVLCQDISIFVDDLGEVSIVPLDIDGGSSDNCTDFDDLVLTASREDFTCDDLGDVIVNLTISDESGNTNSCEAIVTVLDTISPMITCPEDIVIELEPGECEVLVEYELTATDNCDVDVLNSLTQIDDSGLTSGDEFMVGVFTQTYQVTDASGNVSECSFTVTIIPIADPLDFLVCNDHINIAIDQNCELSVNADMFLEGGPYGCYTGAYIVNFLPFGDRAQETGNVNGTAVDFSNLLGTHTYEVIDTANNISCWGTFTVEDNIDPVVVNCDATPTAINCFDVDRFLTSTTLGAPNASNIEDNCISNLDWQLDGITSEEFGTNDCQTRIFRFWVATFPKKNGTVGTLTCTKVYESSPLDVAQIQYPAPLVELSCGASTAPEDLPVGSRYPRIGGVDILPNTTAVCNLAAVFQDNILEACATGCNGNTKTVRTWTIVDWCAGVVLPSFTQIIKAVDTEGPTFIVNDTVASTRPWDCTADFVLPRVWELHDNCDNAPTYTVSGPAGVTVVQDANGDWRATGAAKGANTFTYTASDCCGETTVQTITVTVFDAVAPVVSTVQDIVIGLVPAGPSGSGADGQAKLFWYNVDNNSYDACTDVKAEIRRPTGAPMCGNAGTGNYNNNVTFNNDGNKDDNNRDTDGGEFVKFCCEDVTSATVDVNGDGVIDTGYQEVIIRVWDDADMDGTFGSAGDNYNEAWSYVKVEDNTPPVLTCPDDATIFCDWPIDENQQGSATTRVSALTRGTYVTTDGVNFDKTGAAAAYSTCNTEVVDYKDIIIVNEGDGLNDCGVGVYTRIFRVTKPGKNGGTDVSYCFQKITVLGRPSSFSVTQDKNGNGVLEPSEIGPIDASCSGPTDAMLDDAAPLVTSGSCDVIGRNIEVDTFLFENGVCKKWVATYNYTNWCDDATAGPFLVTFMYRDESPPVIACRDTMYAVDADCGHNLVIENSATDAGGCIEGGWLKWQVFVDTWGDGTVDAISSDFAFTNSWRLETNLALLPTGVNYNPEGVWVRRGTATVSGGTKTVSLPNQLRVEGNMSNHKVTWKVSDGCHNDASCTEEIMVVDKKAPTPYCVSLSTATMDVSDEVELRAIDFNVESFDNCTLEDDLRFTFTDVAPEDDPDYDPARRSSARAFDCEDVMNSPVTVNMYVWDEKGNSDFCVVTLTVTDSDGSCDPNAPRANIAGQVMTATGVGVGQTEMTLMALLPEHPKTTMTAAQDGTYEFANNAAANDYHVTAERATNILEGVNTLDLVKIQRHILALEIIDSPYKLIAADINNDGQIKPSDLLALRKAILGVSTTFPNNKSWRFLDEAIGFTDEQNPWSEIVEEVSMMLLTDALDTDFIGVKVGDVDGSIDLILDGIAGTGTSSSLVLNTTDRSIAAGELVEVTLSSEELSGVYGYQFTLDLQGLQYQGVQEGSLAMTSEHVGVVSKNRLTISYNEAAELGATAGQELFTLRFVATKAGQLSEMLGTSSAVTKAEGYRASSDTAPIETIGVEIAMTGGTEEAAEYALLQNEPNPFITSTVIGFTLPEAAAAQLTVLDVTGKVIMTRTVAGTAGYNQVVLGKNDINVSGVLYYQLQTGDFTATKKMMVIK